VAMTISRRAMIRGTAMTLLAQSVSSSQEPDWELALQESLAQHDSITLGHIVPPPNDASWAEAHSILAAAPTSGAAYRVAEYFKTSVPDKFQMSWPEPDLAHPTYANPLIVLLFVSTHTSPAGDTTPWCAAFANWCLGRIGVVGTQSASSQSFLKWGSEVWKKGDSSLPTSARPGDIAVFSNQAKPGYGHVCFFRGVSVHQPSSIEVIGGNQIKGHGASRIHLIDEVTMRVDGNLELAAIRTIKGLRDAQTAN
jgi:uncharacterized protein (TIGR02594 family)